MSGFAPRGHAKLNPASPAAFAICDRCGFMYCHRDLRWDQQYRGKYLQKTGFLVCDSCFDVPNPTLRPIVLPPDPVPIMNPRREQEHCHVFKPRADIEPPFHSPETRYGRADIKWDNYPAVDHFRDVTVDSGDVCDTRIGTPAPPIPPGPEPGPIPPPPLPIPDASADTTHATADTTGTTTDAQRLYVPLTGFFAVADTTKETADNLINGSDSFPNYTYAADQMAPGADNTTVKSDSQTLSG